MEGADVTSPGADVDIYLRCQISNASSAQVWIVARGSGNSTAETGYFFGIFANNGDIRLRYYNSASQSTVATASATFNTTDEFGLRFNLSGTTLKGRFWNASTSSEPSTWDINTTDSTLTSSGWVGVGQFQTDAIDVLGIGLGTSGDDAPTSASSGDVSITPGAGSATGAGHGPTVSANVNIAPGVGGATGAGHAPTIAADVNITPGSGLSLIHISEPTRPY